MVQASRSNNPNNGLNVNVAIVRLSRHHRPSKSNQIVKNDSKTKTNAPNNRNRAAMTATGDRNGKSVRTGRKNNRKTSGNSKAGTINKNHRINRTIVANEINENLVARAVTVSPNGPSVNRFSQPPI